MTYYTERIQAACRCDAREALVIEEVMRVTTPTLDHLSAHGLVRAARTAKSDLAVLRRTDPDVAAWYERSSS